MSRHECDCGVVYTTLEQLYHCQAHFHYQPMAMSWDEYIKATRLWLEKYPADIFTGESGDSGPVFVTRIRAALEELDAASCEHEFINPDNEIVEAGGYRVCRKCGKLEAPDAT